MVDYKKPPFFLRDSPAKCANGWWFIQWIALSTNSTTRIRSIAFLPISFLFSQIKGYALGTCVSGNYHADKCSYVACSLHVIKNHSTTWYNLSLLKNGINNTITQPIEILTFPLTIWQTAAFSEALHSHPLGSPSCQGNTHKLHIICNNNKK